MLRILAAFLALTSPLAFALPTVQGSDVSAQVNKEIANVETLGQQFDLPSLAILPQASQEEDTPDLSEIRKILRKHYPIGGVLKTPIPNLYQINIGPDIYYLSADGRYLLQGDLIDLKTQSNLTEAHRAAARIAAISEIPDSDLIIYPAIGEKKYTVTVFSDFDCAYCQMLNQRLDRYRQLGIEIRIAAFPRTGLDTPNYQKAQAVWCSEDRQTAFRQASQGMLLENTNTDCDSPVKKEYLTGLRIGVNTTPAFVLQNGILISGYMGPENLSRVLQNLIPSTVQQ